MKAIKRKLSFILYIGIMSVFLVACGKDEKPNNETLLFQYDGTKVYMDEAWIYAKTIQSQYEAWYGSSVWDYQVDNEDGAKTTMEEVTKKDMITQIKMTKVLSNKAKKKGIVLTQEEQKKIQDNAASFMESVSNEEIKKTDISEETLRRVYEENALADKMYDQIKKEADITITDEQCRQYKTYNLLFETFDYGDDGQQVEYSEKKKAQQKQKAEEVYEKIQNGETDLVALATEYHAARSSEYTCGDDADTSQIYIDTMKKLKKGEISPIIESELGYHIIKMLDPNDKKATEQKRKALLEEAQSEYFHKVYNEITKEAEKKWDFIEDVNQDAYKEIIFHQSTTDSEEDSEEQTEEASSADRNSNSITTTASESTESTEAASTKE